MIRLTNSYALALLEYAKEQGLDEIYGHALTLLAQNNPTVLAEATGSLGAFLEGIPSEERQAVLEKFLKLARGSIDLLQAEVFSAVPLSQEQLVRLEIKLIYMFRKQVELTATVDPTLLGGLRVVVGDTVLDDTIKKKLQEMKKSVYKEVYLKQ